jgi:hypothetical protein
MHAFRIKSWVSELWLSYKNWHPCHKAKAAEVFDRVMK